jgi:hypothetical protein
MFEATDEARRTETEVVRDAASSPRLGSGA